MGKKLAAIAAAVAYSVINQASGQVIPSFSGADGAGASATGGRGGVVYHVTMLNGAYNDPNKQALGTLQYGLNDSNFTVNGVVTPRIIVFDVGGTINLGGWDSQSRLNISGKNVTIAGQTAPGGINIIGGVTKLSGSNLIVRNLTFAPGYGARNTGADGMPDSYVYDAIDISGQNAVIDHVSAVYATDEHISLNEVANNITVQYTNMSQGQNYPQWDVPSGPYTGHAFAQLIQPGNMATNSFHHNLYAHQKGRLPRVGSSTPSNWNTETMGPFIGAYNDFRNNVFYNWLGTAGTGASNQQSNNNFVGNFYLAGPGGQNPTSGQTTQLTDGSQPTISNSSGGTGIFDGAGTAYTRVYQSGNVKDINKDGDANDATTLTAGTTTSFDYGRVTVVATPYAVPYKGATDTAAVAYEQVLDYVGANWWTRDGVVNTIDERLIHEVRTGTGQILAWAIQSEWDALKNAPVQTRAAGWDTDADGMPDQWETRHGLNPLVADHNGDFDTDGYTNVEEYINEIAEWPASKAIVFNAATNNRYAQITNWDITWQPSKYDTAVINSGTVVIDAVGQHAGVLQVAKLTNTAATVQVTGGWIEVADLIALGNASGATGNIQQSGGTVLIGNALTLGAVAGSTGNYTLSGGVLVAPVLTKVASGSFNFTGGTLHAGLVTFSLANNGGRLAPGTGIGHTEVQGSLTLASGVLEIDIADLMSDTLGVSGVTQLGGTLDVVEGEGYVRTPGDFWTILIADGGITGSFASITEGYGVSVVGNELRLTAVPEPAAATMVLAGGLVLRRRRACDARI